MFVRKFIFLIHVLFPSRNTTCIPSKILVNVDRSPCNPLHMRLACQGTPSQRPPLHPLSSLLGVTIVDALKLKKSRKRCKYDLATIDTDTVDFDIIKVHDIKYLPPSFWWWHDICIAPYGIGSSKCVWLVYEWHGQDVRWTPLVHNQNNKYS